MPTCQNCYKKWTWKQTLKSGFTIDIGMKCPHCGKTQYLTTKSKRNNFICTLFILSPMLLPMFFNVSAIISLFLIIGFALLTIGLSPLYIELSNDEDPVRW
ncbi:TIGR04104 family putative zinc finger protein [Salipaludibacillus sp. HK11]|uniref:TIGR04104 family putative zinc finger protein n=1 Tax=Salipaludibacillus sp. HK11 TaxID=3394320 RepID=UPI0039FBAE6B